jgi:hypothetical protein
MPQRDVFLNVENVGRATDVRHILIAVMALVASVLMLATAARGF